MFGCHSLLRSVGNPGVQQYINPLRSSKLITVFTVAFSGQNDHFCNIIYKGSWKVAVLQIRTAEYPIQSETCNSDRAVGGDLLFAAYTLTR